MVRGLDLGSRVYSGGSTPQVAAIGAQPAVWKHGAGKFELNYQVSV